MQDAVDVFVFGFQNIQGKDKLRGDIPDNVTIYDPFADETPKKQGFGIELIKNYVGLCDPDVVVVFNDMSIISAVLNELKDVHGKRFKIITYIDQVYLSQKTAYIDFVNANADAALLFSQKWQRCIQDQGLKLPCDFLPHGVNPNVYFPVPHHLARKYYGFSKDDFIILNMNRNQPRKRWDICLKAHAELVHRHRGAPIKLIVATTPVGAWNIPEVFVRELRKRGIPVEEGLKHILFVDAPQRMSDREVNMLYNVCDVGMNTCDGEGFGLCNVEQACVGKPQIVSRLGAFPDVFDDDCAMLVEPKCEFNLDTTRDTMGGEALMCSYKDFTDAASKYYEDRELRERHGATARKRILKDYNWNEIARKLVDFARITYGELPPAVVPHVKTEKGKKQNEEDQEYDIDVDEVRSLMDNIDQNDAKETTPLLKIVDESEKKAPLHVGHKKDDTNEKQAPVKKEDDFSFDISNKKQENEAIKKGLTAEEKRAKHFEKLKKEMAKMQAMMASFADDKDDEDTDKE
jgi:glycosyltransferase involved in cell wall biosynthesis